MASIRSRLTEYRSSIKSFDTEEKIDLYFYRPIGHLLAKIAVPLKLTPTNLSLIGLVSGLLSGFCFIWSASLIPFMFGAFFLIFAGLLDSADGQLARLTGRSTRLGIMLDGICDSVVFASAYLGAAIAAYGKNGAGIFLVAILGLICHSFHSSLLDFFNREYLYFGYGKTANEDNWNPTIKEAWTEYETSLTPKERIFTFLRYLWTWPQHLLAGRTDRERMALKLKLRTFTPRQKERFTRSYRLCNRRMIRLWRFMGANFHTIAFLLFVFIGQFNWYLIYIDILFLNVMVFILSYTQRKLDMRLYEDFAVGAHSGSDYWRDLLL